MLTNKFQTVILVIRLCKYRSSFNSILASSNTTRSRFVRLFAIAALFILGITPIQIFIIVTQHPHNHDFYSFSTIHDPTTWNSSIVFSSSVLQDRWLNLAFGLLIFFIFGLGRDAQGMYREGLVKIGLGGCFPWLFSGMSSSSQHSRRGVTVSSSSGSSKIPLGGARSSWIKTGG
jgi:pheromone a factor receptor